MKKVAIALYSIAAYLLFLSVFLYLIGFVANVIVPKGIDEGATGPAATAALINGLLLLLFGATHSVMARPWFKRWLTRFVPRRAERSSYVMVSSLLLGLLMWQWRPFPSVIWQVEGTPAELLWLIHASGWIILLLSTFLINHFELFGLQQGVLPLLNRSGRPLRFVTPLLYRLVRHPMMLGILIAFWVTPLMTVGHLLFAMGMTGYMLVGLHLEERDLVAAFGAQYRAYQRAVPMLLPRLPQTPARHQTDINKTQ